MADAVVRDTLAAATDVACVRHEEVGAEAGVGTGTAIEARVDALRRDGACDIDPVRFRFIEALARRGATLQGDAKRIVAERLATAVAECRVRLAEAADERSAGQAHDRAADASAAPAAPALSPLAALVRDIEAHSATLPAPGSAGRAEGAAGGEADSPVPEGQASRRELKSLRYFRKDWSRLGVEQQLARALAQGPRNAGPLNSHGLILQSLQAMRDLSPACLERTMAWLDTLLWLDDATAGPLVAPAERVVARPSADKPAPRAPADRKRKTVRTKAR